MISPQLKGSCKKGLLKSREDKKYIDQPYKIYIRTEEQILSYILLLITIFVCLELIIDIIIASHTRACTVAIKEKLIIRLSV